MVQRLKSWESPRRQGRNDKGKGGSARQRQLRKRQQMLRNRLKNDSSKEKGDKPQERKNKGSQGREIDAPRPIRT